MWSLWWLLPVGVVIGAYGTMIGAGGGFLLMPLLLLAFPKLSPAQTTAISLAMIFCNAASGTAAYARMRRIDYKLACIYGLSSLPGAVLGSLAVNYIPRRPFQGIFGVVLLAVAIFLFLRPGRLANAPGEAEKVLEFERTGKRPYDLRRSIRIGIPISMFVGFLATLLGIGGGIVHVPALVNLLAFPVHLAVPMSHFVVASSALISTLVHLSDGSLRGGLWHAMWVSIGVIVGAQLGARLSRRVHGMWIIRALAGGMALVGARILLQALLGK
jgi:uncharacterized protein